MLNISCIINGTLKQGCRGRRPAETVTDSHTYITISTVLLSILIPVILFGNVLVILAFATTRRLRNRINYFVLSLAIADLLVGVLSLPIFTIGIHEGPMWLAKHPEVIQLWTAIDMITSVASIVNLMFISVDRFVCIQYPLRYHSMLTKSKVIVMIGLSWLYGGFNYSMIKFTYREKRPRPDIILIVTILAFILPLLIILVMYGKVGKIAFSQRMRIIDEQEQANQGNKNKRTLSLITELKATRTLAIVVGAFLLCFIGYFVLLLHTAVCLEWMSLKCKRTPEIVPIAMNWIKYFNSSLNPLIYTIMNSDMRKAMHRVLKKKHASSELMFELRSAEYTRSHVDTYY